MPLEYGERALVADARRMAYMFFADVFSTEVTKDFIAGMASFGAVEGSKLSEFVTMIGESDLDQVTQDVRSEFCALFLNMSAHPVFTSESVYLSGNHMIMQEQRNQVLEVYNAHHLSVDKESFDWPEDHISMEVLFMAHLCQLESDSCRSLMEEAGDDLALAASRLDSAAAAQKAFFTEHLDQWVPMFVEELSRYAETLFYQGVAEYLGEFLDGERELLNEF
ncbi:molecular chaperone [uncultured Senegalimassilia sp.]|uniref:TorD/DmsD family molecular chaperone n=1 Tax=uncultured Senegalimassilia sp. TaxID=1714350 RepID=UPI002671AD77|nr:molecular chaperone TorD family protein [uncultured Senegalimassilia sp.]